jgi:integrase
MATFKVVADKRYTKKNNTNRYCLRATVNGTVRYLPLQFQLTPEQHALVFSKKAMGAECIDFREKIKEIEIKAERVYISMRRYDAERFKKLFYDQGKTSDDQDSSLPRTLSVTELFQYYADNTQIKEGTKIHMKVCQSMLNKFQSGVYIDDIDVKFLKSFEKNQLDKGKSISTIASYMRDIRTVTNYFSQVKKILPADYEYPFGKGGYSIKAVRKKKNVLSADEILAVISHKKFEDPKQEYARNIWLCLYYMNGLNIIDLLRLRWENVEYNHIHLFRKKTETTRKSNIQELVMPLTPDLKHYLNLVGDPTSPFVLGKIKEGYTETALRNRKNRFRQEINTELKNISKSMKLTVPLIMASARDCYASTLDRNGVPRESISNMLGHSDPRTTAHYLDSISIDGTFKVNAFLVKGKIEANVEEAAEVA